MNCTACELDLDNVFTQIHIDPFLLFLLGSLPSMGFPSVSDGKESACNAGDLGSVCGLGRSPGVGNGKALQYSCLENPMDRGTWQATVHGVVNGCTSEQLIKKTRINNRL